MVCFRQKNYFIMLMKIIVIYDSGCNLPYFIKMIDILKEKHDITLFSLDQFIKKINIIKSNKYDVAFYQTFPDDRLFPKEYMNAKLKNKKKKIIKNLHFNEIDYYPEYPLNMEENVYNFKFNVNKIKITDKLFIEIQSIVKILVDLHADSDQDGFSRFSKVYHPLYQKTQEKFYRVKNVSSMQYYIFKNVISSTCYNITEIKSLSKSNIESERHIFFHYSVSLNNDFRVELQNILLKSKYKDIINFNKFNNYPKDLNNVFVEICAHGYGKGCIRDIYALNYGCLLLLHESLNDVFILPHKVLIDNVDCLYYNFGNIESKLDYIYNNREECSKIAYNSSILFHQYYNYEKSAKLLETSLESLI